MKIDGEVEAVSREGKLGAPGGHVWIKLKGNSQTYLAPITLAATIREGQQVVLQCVESHFGPKVQSVVAPGKTEGSQAIVSAPALTIEQLAERILELKAKCKQALAQGLLDFKWEVGREICQTRLTNDSSYRDLETKTGISYEDLRCCAKFFEKFPNRGYELKAWRKVIAELSASNELPRPLPVNAPATPEELVEAYRPEPKPLPRSESKPALQMRRILNTLHIDHLSEEPIPVETARGPITYIADFLIGTLIVEVDSALHDPDRDQERDLALRKANYDVLRFPDSQVAAAYDLIIQLEARIHGKPLEAPAR